MSANPRRRHGFGEWIIRVDWKDLADRALRVAVVVGWFGFVGLMLVAALKAAP